MHYTKKKLMIIVFGLVFLVMCIGTLWAFIHTSYFDVKNMPKILNKDERTPLNTSEVPPALLESKSPYFEMFYITAYGVANEFSVDTSASLNENWKQYFPELFTAIEKYSEGSFETPLSNTIYYYPLVDVDRTSYNVGDVFQARITSRNPINGERKSYGGDYYRARLISNSSSSEEVDGIPCKIADNSDGTYDISAPLLLSGALKLDLQLVIPLENINKIVKKTENAKSWNYGYFATLTSGQEIFCDMHLNQSEGIKLCDYSNPRNQEPWYCRKPDYGNCSKITKYRYYGAGLGQNRSTLFRDVVTEKPFRSKIPTEIEISVADSKSKAAEGKKLQDCSSMFDNPTSSQGITGYYKNKKWVSLQCHNTLVSPRQIGQCLKNKVIYVLSDSMIPQLVFFAQTHLKLDINVSDTHTYWQKPKFVRSNDESDLNITVYYRAHGPPLPNPGPPSLLPYISDSISTIQKGGKNVYILISIGLHLLNYNPSYYIHRLKGIKLAIMRHHKVFPETRVIIKGLNLSEYDFEWGLLRYNVILKKIFENMKNVIFFDSWDMTTVRPQEDHHPNQSMVSDQALLLFGHLCSKTDDASLEPQ